MMVESLLDVLLQTLLSIMSKSHSVETSRGQRCPQCTAEITVRARTTTRFLFPSAASTSTTSEHAPACVCCFFYRRSRRASTSPACSRCSSR